MSEGGERQEGAGGGRLTAGALWLHLSLSCPLTAVFRRPLHSFSLCACVSAQVTTCPTCASRTYRRRARATARPAPTPTRPVASTPPTSPPDGTTPAMRTVDQSTSAMCCAHRRILLSTAKCNERYASAGPPAACAFAMPLLFVLPSLRSRHTYMIQQLQPQTKEALMSKATAKEKNKKKN